MKPSADVAEPESLGRDLDPEPVAPGDWPFLPLRPVCLAHPPPVGSWAWFIPERSRHTSFHEVADLATLEEDGASIQLVVTSCGRAWPLEEFAVFVSGADPVLERRAHGTRARCSACLEERRSGPNFWMRRLEGVGLTSPLR